VRIALETIRREAEALVASYSAGDDIAAAMDRLDAALVIYRLTVEND